MDEDKIIAAFHRVLLLKDRAVCASIDAANCQTRYDWQKSHEASDALEAAIEQFEKMIAALAEGQLSRSSQPLARRATASARVDCDRAARQPPTPSDRG
jgi:hypothetical protein